MKQIFSNVIIPLAIGLTVAYFAFNLNKEFVDLRFTISEKIPTKFIETSTAEAVQQLVVKNNGNIPATKIQIKIDGLVEEYDILKNSVNDIVTEHNSKGHFEAIYPSLPPDGQFSYIFKTTGEGITENNIEITHNKGKAKEALTSDRNSIYSQIGGYIYLAVIVFYVVFLIYQGRSMAIDHLESSGSYTNYYEYLSKKKPFYVSQEKWNSIRRKYIEKKIKAEYFHTADIEEQESYKILSQDKPKFLSGDEWELLKECSTKCLADQMTYSIKTSSIYDDLQKYFTIKQPKNFPENKWKEIVEEINKNFITSKKLSESSYLSPRDIIKELKKGMPTGMSPTYWDKYKDYLLNRYYETVYRDILREVDPITYLKEIDLSVLNKEKQNFLSDLAYRIKFSRIDISSLYSAEQFQKNEKPIWIKPNDLEKLEKKAQAYIYLKNTIRKNESLSNVLHDIVNLTPLKDKPDALNNKDWEIIVDLESKISAIAIKIEEDKLKLESEKLETKELKDKILKQLAIINDVLNDPKSIDRIENYDNPFSEGNFKNLQKVFNYSNEMNKIT